MDFFGTIDDLFGGGGQDDYYSASQNPPASKPSKPTYTPTSYSDLGTSPGFPGPATSVPTVSPPMSPFQLGFGGAQKVPNYMDDLNTLMGGGGSSADASAVSVSDQLITRQPTVVGPGEPSDAMIGLPLKKQPDPISVGPGEPSDEMVGLPLVTKPLAKPSVVDQQPQVTAAQAEDAQKKFNALTSLRQPKTDQDFNFVNYVRELFGNLFKTGGSKAKSFGDFISNLTPGSAFKLFNDFLIGDQSFKGPSPAQLDLMGVPGPGPEVGGGVPSPSGVLPSQDKPMVTMPDTPAETVMKKDPCPPGFKLDPILNQCMPIVKSAPTPPPMPTLPQPTAPTGGGIANVYPFTLTPPVGAPVGTVAPIRFTPK